MKKIKLKSNTPNLDRLARDSRPGTTPVSLKVKNNIYAILDKVAENNNTSVGAIINELLNNYISLDSNYLYSKDEEDNAKQLIKSKICKLGKRLKNFNDIELLAYICEQSKNGLIDGSPFESPTDVDRCIVNDEGDIYLNTVSAPAISFGENASFDPNLDSIKEADLSFPIYSLVIKKDCAKFVLPLLFSYVSLYNQYILHDKYDSNRMPCLTEKQFRELVHIMNAESNNEKIIDRIVEALIYE